MNVSAIRKAIVETENACGILRAMITRAVSLDDKSFIVLRENIPMRFAVAHGQLIAAFPCTIHSVQTINRSDAVRYCALMTEEGEKNCEVEAYTAWLLRTLQEMNEMTGMLKSMVD